MPVRPDEKAARSERAQAIGLFRYRLIREAANPAAVHPDAGGVMPLLRPAEVPLRR
jgi:hypothetical protein